MEMMMLVLVSAVAMLINPYAANPVSNNNLNRIIDLTEKYNRDLNEVRLTNPSLCSIQNNFFCKVHDILQKHAKNDNEKDIMNCEEVLKKLQPSDKEKPLPDLLGNLTKCIQRRNLTGNVTQAA
uniref:Uncharacterized protein n=1 Tax=Neolamprologus brichardi TaxID=32507 RepID=A0A3Q4GKT1_NEOBR